MGNLDTAAIKEFYDDVEGQITNAEDVLIKCVNGEGTTGSIDELFRFFHNVKGTSGMFGLIVVPEVFHIAESLLNEYRKHKIIPNQNSANVMMEVIDRFKQIINHILQSGEEPEDRPYDLMDKLQRMKKVAMNGGEEETNGGSGKERGEEKESKNSEGGKKKDDSIRLSSKNLEELIEMVSQFIQIQNQLESTLGNRPELQPLKNEIRNFSSRIQNFILKIQLTPIAPLLKGMSRILMNACQETGKMAKLEIIGGDTQFDRRAIEQLRDPLIHMIRNSIDHGIESPEDREGAHKNKEGVIIFEAFQRSGQVILTMSDDGRGISTDKIRKKALEKELINPDDAETMTEDEILHLIFLPGFSTADQVTSLSGRGVGMDSVKTTVESMGGQISLTTEVGKGTTITLALPLSMAIVKSVVFNVGDQLYAIAENSIHEILTHEMGISRKQLAFLENGELALHIKKEVIPVFKLYDFFEKNNMSRIHQAAQGSKSTDRKRTITNNPTYIVINYKGSHFALQTHDIVGPRDFVAQAVPSFYKNIKFINGVNQENTGEYIALLDLGVFNDLVRKVDNPLTMKTLNKNLGMTVSDVFRSEMRLLFFKTGKRFAVPVQLFTQIVKVPKNDISVVMDKCYVTIKEKSYAVLQFSKIFAKQSLEERDFYTVLITHKEGKECAIVCEEFYGIHRLPEKFEVLLKTEGIQGMINFHSESYLVANIHAIFDMEFPDDGGRKAKNLEKFNILIAEDDTFFATLLQDAIKARGISVTLAQNGKEAMEFLQESLNPDSEIEPFDYLITDYEMPEMDGIKLLKWIRKHPDLQNLPVSMCTAVGDSTTRELVTRLGVDNYTGKLKYEQVFNSVKMRMKDKQLGVVRSTHSTTEEALQSSIQRVLVFEINKKRYGIEIVFLKDISKCSVATRMPQAMDYVGRYVGFRGYPIMVLDLRYLGGGINSIEPKQIVVGLNNGNTCALWVDEVIKVSILDEMDKSMVIKNNVVGGKKGKDYISGLLKDMLWLDNQAVGLLDIEKIQSFLDIVSERFSVEDSLQQGRGDKKGKMLKAS